MKLTNLIKSKTLVFSLLAATFSFSLVACNQPYESPEPAEEGPTEEELLLAQKKEAYKFFLGTWICANDGDSEIFKEGDAITFTESSISFNDTSYAIDLDSDLYYDSEHKEPLWDDDSLITVKTDKLFMSFYRQITSGISYYYVWIKGDDMVEIGEKPINPLPGAEGSEASELEGTYSFNTASGSQVNGSFTLNSDGTWSYSGLKSTLIPTTYSVNGDKITLKWTSESYGNTYERTDTLTVELNGSEATLTSTDSTLSALFSDFFGVATTTTLTLAFSAE